MKRLPQIGWALVCISLVAPAVARAEPVSVMSAIYEASFFQGPAEREQATPAQASVSIFSWCRRCIAPDASPFLVGAANLSALPTSKDSGVNVVFNGGFAASFGGEMTLPIPGLSSTTTPNSNSNTPTVTIPIAPGHGDDQDHDGGGAPSGTSIVQHGLGGSSTHDSDHTTGHVVAGIASTGHAALSKAESLAATPEPATLLLLGTGLMAMAGSRAWRRRF